MTTPSEPDAGGPAEPVVARRDRPGTRLAILALLAAVLGALTAFAWSRTVPLPAYEVLADGSTRIDERALTEFFAGDAWFAAYGAVIGLVLGLLSWRWFKSLGWPSALIAVGTALLAAVVCWRLGVLLGPGPLDDRLAAAQPGDRVPIALDLTAPSALAVWAFTAIAPVLFASSLGPEEGEEGRRRRRRQPPAEETEGQEHVDDRGVMTP